MGFKDQQAAIQKELERFLDMLAVLLPRYSVLLKTEHPTEAELTELGETEHFLIGVTARVTEIQQLLERNVFGASIDLYYKLKEDVRNGDENALYKMNRLRDNFTASLRSGEMMSWN